MARLSFAEAAMKVASIQVLRGHSLQAISRAKRLELAPKLPNAQIAAYMRLMKAYERESERLTAQLVLPALPVTDARPLLMDTGKSLDEAFAELNAQLLGVADRMAPHIGTIARAVTKQANGQVARMLNVDLRGGESELEPFVHAFIQKNVSLVKSVSFDQLAKLRTIISEHTEQGGGAQELRNKLMDSFGLTRQRASLIARDQILKAAASTNELRQKQVGVTTYTWSTSQDERVRGNPDGKYPNTSDNHWKLDGQVFDWNQPPIVDEKTGRREHPGQDFSCRCVAVANVAGLLGQGTGGA
jgi:SPP1 gp7 family putative phage head morphogenesis protein